MTSRNSALRQVQRIALLVAMACWAAARAEAQAPAGFGVGSYGVVPGSLAQARPNVITWDGTTMGVTFNTLLGADRFYNAGIYGQYASAANVEAGNIWNQHETLTKVTYEYTAPGAAGDFDWHATAVGMIIAGLGPPAPGGGYYYYQMGIAPFADLYSGAMATSWSPGGSFYFSDQTFYDAYNNFFTTSFLRSYGGAAIIAPNDVINSSWGGTDTTGTATSTLALDGFARANPLTTFVAAAGNSGTSNGVLGPASGYNGISVGATGDFSLSNFNVVASFSSRGPQDYYDPVHGLVPGVRAAVDLVAPGTSIATAYYGGTTGSNQFAGSDPSGGATDWYTIGAAGTSFAAPMVSGGVALLKSASYINGLGPESRDTRVIKAVLMNSATKLPGWNNGQSTNAAGVVVTTQALDWAQGAGQLNLNRAYDQYLSGTMDVPGTSGGTIASIGWDYGTLTIGGHNDYTIQGTLHGGTMFDATLDWFRNCAAPSLDANHNLVVSNNGFANLDLEVWNSTFTRLYAVSNSLYNNVQELHFLLPGDGQYAIRVDYTGQMFGTPVTEPYGLAWNNLTSTVSATYTRAATSGSGTIIVGGVTDVAASIRNTATDPAADSLLVSNLRPVASGGTVTAGTAYSGSLAPGGMGSTAGFTFTAAAPGTYTLTPAVDQADNALLGGPAVEDPGSPITAAARFPAAPP